MKNIALVAHDNKKKDLIEWCDFNKGTLSRTDQPHSACLPTLQSPGRIRFVAFTSEEVLDCSIIFLFHATSGRRQTFLPAVKGPTKTPEFIPANSAEQLGAEDVFEITLYLPEKPTAVQVYDTFNKMFKPKAFESKGPDLPSNPKLPVRRLSCQWKIRGDKFETVLKEIETSLGQEWYKFFSRQQ